MRIRSITPVVLALAACSSDAAEPPKHRADDTPARLAGVWPDRFKCDTIATTDALAQVLGGPTRAMDNAVSTQRGVAHPCNYEVIHDGVAEYWFFDFDCRDGMKRTADGLFEQYRQRAADLTAEYNRRSDAGPMKPDDAGVVFEKPGEALDVQVGSKGVDDGGRGLVFIDDDAPCYARVIGKDGVRRLELARLIAKNLTFANAPMNPRPLGK